MRLLVAEDHMDADGNMKTVYVHNSKVDYIIPCKNKSCHGFGTRSQYGYDEKCPECGGELDWERERKW